MHRDLLNYTSGLGRLMVLGSSIAVLPISAHAQTAMTVTLNPSSLGRTIPSDFEGLSIEMFYVVDLGTTTYPTTNGDDDVIADAWFDSGSSAIGTLFQTLGVKSMRIGGTTTEEPTLLDANATYPQQYDAAHVSNFAQQWGLELIWDIPVAADYNLSTYTSYIESMVSTQKSKGQNFKEIWEIGNEPDQQNVGASTYDARFDAYLGALRSDIGTSVQVLGPSELSTTSYIGALMADPEYDSSSAPWHSNIYAFSHHFYPFGCASGQSSLDAAIGEMLELHYTLYTDLYNSWAATAASYGYNTRYDEGNSFCGGGYSGASNAFAAALWGLDVLEYHAHNTTLGGINFHVADGATYSAFSPQLLSSTYTTQGLGYGMLAFNTDGAGQVVPTTLSGPAGAGTTLNVTAYGTKMSNGSETAIVINKTSVIKGDDTDFTLTVVPGASYKTASVYYLQAPNNDPTQTSGITFGGSSVSSTGTWSGSTTTFTANSSGNFIIPISYTEAAVINMHN